MSFARGGDGRGRAGVSFGGGGKFGAGARNMFGEKGGFIWGTILSMKAILHELWRGEQLSAEKGILSFLTGGEIARR